MLDARFDYKFDTSNGSLNLYFNINDLLDSEPEEFYGRVQLERSGRHRPQRDG